MWRTLQPVIFSDVAPQTIGVSWRPPESVLHSGQRLKDESAMNRNRTWKNAGLCAGFVAVLAAPAALHAMVAPPTPKPVIQGAKTAAGDSFLATCIAAADLVDTRPDPAWIGASFGGDNCWAPRPPSIIDGENSSRAQIVAAMATEKSYKAGVAAYQMCIANVVASRKAAADKMGKPMDVAFVTIESHRVTAGEENQKKADRRIAAEIEAFNLPGSECN
jgi:hypothetical protein